MPPARSARALGRFEFPVERNLCLLYTSKIVRRVRISYTDPIVDLTSAAVQSRVSEYIITIDRWATKRLNNQRLRILCGDGMVRERNIPFAFHFITIYRGEQRSNSRKR